MGAGYWKDQTLIRSLESSVPPHSSPNSPERGEGQEMELMTDQSYLHDEDSIKPQKYGDWGASRLVNTFTYWEGDTPPTQPGPVLRTLPDLILCISSSGCSSVSFNILF